MATSTIEYDVYNTPRIGAVQFGDFVAAEGIERESILQGAKFVRRTHRARAWFAKDKATDYLTGHTPNIGVLIAALETAKAASNDSSLTEQQQKDALASKQTLEGLIALANQLPITGKRLIKIEEEQAPLDVGGTAVFLPLACLTLTAAMNRPDQVGALFINSLAGKGLGVKDETKRKRDKAGESVALLVFKRLIEQHSDIGEPNPTEAIHIYARAEHFWTAPTAYARKLGNIEATGRTIGREWPRVTEPDDLADAIIYYHD